MKRSTLRLLPLALAALLGCYWWFRPGASDPDAGAVVPLAERPGFSEFRDWESPESPDSTEGPGEPRRGGEIRPREAPGSAESAFPASAGGEPPSPLPVLRSTPLSDPAERSELSREVAGYLDSLRRHAAAEADRLGYPLRTRDADGRPLELVAFLDGQPVYLTTFNAIAAMAARVTPLHEGTNGRTESNYELFGEGMKVGVWDEARVLDLHSEFDDRVTNHYREPVYSHHSTHVAGTIAAQGVLPEARGMAPLASIESYNWDQALAEMANRAPLYPGEPESLPFANHSYGLVAGWYFLPDRNAFVFSGFERFGQYDPFAYLTDIVAHAAPYQLSVWAAGNHRTGDPSPGDPVLLNEEPVPYDPDIHPPGDAEYKRGFDTINSFQIAKNVLTVGALNYSTAGDSDATINEARMTSFSSWGPTDDGRVKPDIVAHGVSLLSPVALDGWYGRASGTSMAAPAVTGSLALLSELFDRHFPGHALRASTLKALLVHSADNLGNPGPDSRYGWGLLNAHAAAEIVADYAASPRPNLLVEDTLSENRRVAVYGVRPTGDEPLRITLAWTDPPHPQPINQSDDRTPTLVNNLNVRVIPPGGATVHHPYRLNPDLPAAPATTGRNDVDNVLRVDVPSPADTGTYTVAVDYRGPLLGDEQFYSLIVTGAEATASLPGAPFVSTMNPAGAPNRDTVVVDVFGSDFLLGTDLRLSKSGADPIDAFGVEKSKNRLRARFDLYAAPPGMWDLEIHSADGAVAVLDQAFEVEPDCHFTLQPETVEIGSSGGFFSAQLETSLEHCEWTLESTEDWLLFLTSNTGQGDAEIIYSVGTHNGSAIPRNAEIRIDERTLLTVEQDGVAPVTLRDAQARNDFITGRDRQHDWKYYRFEVPHITSGKLEILLESLTRDADLYVRHGEKPDLENFDCRPALGGTQEELCEFANPKPGTWWIGVNNWDTGRIDYTISASLTVEELSYDDWAENVFSQEELDDPAVSSPGADPGGFGIPNVLRYALLIDPRYPEREGLPRVGRIIENGNEYLYIEYTMRKAAPNLEFHVEGSEDLEEWSPVDGIEETIHESAASRTVRLVQAEPLATPGSGFLRLWVNLE